MSSKVIDTFNSLNFISDYNANGTEGTNKVIISSGGVLTLFNTTQSQYSSIGALVLQSGGLSINALTNATSVSNGGALTVAGGAAIAGDLIVGGTISYANAEAASSTFAYLTLTSSDQSTDIVNGSLITFGGISVQTSGDATSITSGGGITVAGGVAIGSSLYVGGTSNLTDVVTTNLTTGTLRSTSATIPNVLFTNVSASTLNVTGLTAQNINFTGSLYQNGSLYISSQWTTFGSNVAYTSGNVGINTTSPSYKLDVNGALRVSGTTGSLNLIASSTTTDILQVQNTNASGASTLQFLNNSSVSKGTLGFGNPNGSQFQNTMYMNSVTGVPINFVAGNNSANPFILNASDNSVSITSTTAAVDTSSGSLKVSGGASIRGDLYIGGAVNVNSPLTVNINNTSVSSNSTTGSMKLIGGLSISVTDTTNSNATSYTAGGGITVRGGVAISQDTFIGGVLDIQSGSNNMNPVKLQSLQISSNYNNGASTVIQSGDASRTSTSFTPIAFSGYNDQSNPKLTINALSIVTGNALTATNTSNTIGPLVTTGGNVGIGTSSPSATLDISTINTFGNVYVGNSLQNRKIVLHNAVNNEHQYFGFGVNSGVLRYQINGSSDSHIFYAAASSTTSTQLFRITGTGNVLVTGTSNSVAVSSGNIFSTNITVGTLNASSGLTAGNINFTGSLFQNGSLYVSSQWLGTTGTTLYYGTSGSALVGIGTSNPSFNLDVAGTSRISTSLTTGALYATNSTITNAVKTNLSAGTINSTGLTTGNINFTGALYQNGSPYVGSQWSGTTGNLLYYGSSGNTFVGIGTTNPGTTLDINGSLRTTSLFVTSTSGSINSTSAQYIFGSLSVSNTADVSSYTQGGGLTIAGGLAVGKSVAIANALGMSGITSEIAGTFSAANNVGTATNVTGLLFPTANIRSFTVQISIQLLAGSGNLYAHYTIDGIQNASGWAIDDSFVGDFTGISFSINSSGQIQYTSSNITGWISNTFNYKSTSYSISGNYIQNAPPTSGNFLVTQNLTVQGTTDASSASYGSFVTAGGAGIGKSVNVGGSVVINNVSATSSGTFNAANGTVTNANITGLLFDPATYRSFSLIMSVSVSRTTGGNLMAQYTIEGIQRDSGWNIFVTNLGDTIDLTFSINTSTGQLQYSSTTTYTNWSSTVFNYQTTVLYISGGFSTFSLPSGAQTLNGALTITNTTESTDTSTGAMIVSGGVAIQKNLNIGGGINSNNINLGVSSLYSGSFIASNNVVSPTNVTGLTFANADIRYFEAKVVVTISVSVGLTLDTVFTLRGTQNDSSWDIYTESIGDTSGITFSITSAGQVQYTSTNVSNFTSSVFRYSVQQFTKSGTYTASPSNTSGSYLLNSAQITSTTDAISGTSVGALQVLGGVTINKSIVVGGNVQFSGGIAKTQFYSAQNGDFTAIEVANNSTTLTTATSISFTPVNTGGRTSQIICQCFYRWRCTGGSADTFTIQLHDSTSNVLDYCSPTYLGGVGGGGREGAKPLMGYISTATTGTITFNLVFGRLSSDDFNYIDLTYTKFIVQQLVL